MQLNSMVQFHTFGDSHASAAHSVWRFQFANPTTELVTHHLGPVLMHSFGTRGLGLLNIANFGVAAGDWACFCFGEIDCRCHVHKHITEDRDYRAVINDLVAKYETAIAENLAKVPGAHGAVFMLPPSVHFMEVPHEFPFLGTDEERKRNTIYCNALLKDMCSRRTWVFVDAYDEFTDEDGFLRMDRSDGICHMRYTPPIQAIVEDFVLSKLADPASTTCAK